jgi:methyl-accepting chemotaxis protein
MSIGNMKLSSKLYSGFGLLMLLVLIVGSIAWMEFRTSSGGFARYKKLAQDTNLTGRLQANMLMVRMNVKDFIITSSQRDKDEYQAYYEKMNAFLAETVRLIKNPARAAMIKEISEQMGGYESGFAKVVEYQQIRNETLSTVLNVKGPEMERSLSKVMHSAYKDENTEVAYFSGEALRSLLLARLYVVKFLDDNSKASAQRVGKEFSAFTKGMQTLKNIVKDPERNRLLAEVDSIADAYLPAFEKLSKAIWARNEVISGTLDVIGSQIAKLSEDVKLSLKGAQDGLGVELDNSNQQALLTIALIAVGAIVFGVLMVWLITRSITGPINRVISGLKGASSEVTAAAQQVSNSSQSLAQGSSEQAASLEETSSSMEEMASMTKQNADNSKHADSLSTDATDRVKTAAGSMKEMRSAMERIDSASDEMSKIVKSIDEIAFQTNLLALNAAVEAARAGEAGAGFAVVADEVRNLAMRAAEAAKSTSGLIEDNIKNIKEGTDLVVSTDEGFAEVYNSFLKVAELVGEISAASQEQSTGIGQVNLALSQMDEVTQSNAANAEESAAASEQLSTQAMSMDDFVNDLARLVSGAQTGRNERAAAITHENRPRISGHKSAGSIGARKNIKAENMIPLMADDDDFQSF